MSENLQSVLQENGGMIPTAGANAVGISNEYLRRPVGLGKLERVAHGVYISSNDFTIFNRGNKFHCFVNNDRTNLMK